MPQGKEKPPLWRRGAAAILSPAVWVAGPSVPAPPEGAWVKSWPSAAGQRKAPLVQRGDSMAKPCRGDCEAGGMIQLVFYCRVREHRLAVRTPDREHRLGAEARRQSLSRRSPTAPFAQGSRLCCSAHNHPFLWRWARIAKQPLPGDGLSHPEHRGRAVHKAFSEFWVQRDAGPVSGRPFLSLPD